MKIFTRTLLTTLLVLPSLFVDGQSLDPNNKRGFEPGKVYNFSGLDSVSTFSGNLNVAIPIGQSYEVRPGFSYQFVLSYNSRIWDFVRNVLAAGETDAGGLERLSVPESYSNAGFGWLLSVGRVIVPGGLVHRYTYVSADGAHHEFYGTLRGSGSIEAGVLYTNDGTYMRMTLSPRTGTVTGIQIETRDGLIHSFNGSGDFIRTADRYGNWLEVVRDDLVWTFNEGRGANEERLVARSHSITFENAPPNTYAHENFKRRVKEVALAAFPNPGNPVQNEAVFTFEYEDTEVDGSSCGSVSPNKVPLLKEVVLPDGSAFEMTYDLNQTCSSAAITSLALPTTGRIDWTYTEYPMARDVCILDAYYTGDLWHDSYPGVSKRTLRSPNGILLEETVYTPALLPRAETGTITCNDYATGSPKPKIYPDAALPPKVFTNAVATKSGAKTVHHFSAFRAVGQQYAVPDAFERDYGLPLTRTSTSAAIPLSTETFSSGGGLLRSTYVEYETDGSPGTRQINQRATIVRTVFEDDDGDFDADPDGEDTELQRCKNDETVAPCWIQQNNEQFDGFGHYRSQKTTSNYASATVRTAFTNYNPGMTATSSWPSGSPWVLDTFTDTSVVENGATFSSATIFDQAGSLVSTKIGTDPGALVSATCRDGYGLITSQRWLGGDGLSVTGDPCAATRRTTEAVLTHTYDRATGPLVGHTATWDGTTHKVIDETLDGNTGLPSSTRDGAGLATSYVFDSSGRLVKLHPPGLAATTYTFSNASVSSTNVLTPAQVEVSTTSADTSLGSIKKQFQFDAAGRLWREKTLMPDDCWSVRETLYNTDGFKASVSEMEKLVVPADKTEFDFKPTRLTKFSNYDALARPHAVATPDSRTTILGYLGDRVSSREVSIATAADGTMTRETTVERRDAHGRLASVTEKDVVTAYGYHVSGKLASVTMTSGAATQTREFKYNTRGLLEEETHPELGASGKGKITWSNFDSRGTARRKRTGTATQLDLTMRYDSAGRLTKVHRTSDEDDIIEQYLFTPSTGRLQATARYNQVPHLGSIVVTEGWQYDAATGLPSRRDTTIGTSTTFTTGRNFANTQFYNDLGLVSDVGYPYRTEPSETQRIVSYTFDNGLLGGVTDWASLSYQPNGTIAEVAHNGEVRETWTTDPHGMPRPRAISVTRSGSALWSSGDYAFDGAGNIKSIGNRNYIYDSMSRLAGWKDDHGGGAYAGTTLTYDGFGNLLGSSTENCGAAAGYTDCYVTSMKPSSISGTTNHYTDATYDAAGSVLTDRGRTFTYDPVNMPTSVVTGGRTFVYLYAAGNERVAAVEWLGNNTYTTTWTLRGFGNELLSVRDGDTWKEDEIWRGSSLIGQLTPTGKRHYSLDHLGSPRVITDDAGTLIGTQSFAPFGAGGSADGGALQFTGHERDRASLGDGTVDLPDYAHARLLDVNRGRFLSVDPTWERADLGKPQTWNRYAYVTNNPINLTDPDGKNPFAVGLLWELATDFVTDGSPTGSSADLPDLTKPLFGGTVTRYMTEGEARIARETGQIPNVGRDGKPRPTHVTTDKPTDNATTAQKRYEIDKPTHRATVPEDRVPGGLGPAPDGRATTSGGGSQAATNRPIPVKPNEIKPLDRSLWRRIVNLFL